MSGTSIKRFGMFVWSRFFCVHSERDKSLLSQLIIHSLSLSLSHCRSLSCSLSPSQLGKQRERRKIGIYPKFYLHYTSRLMIEISITISSTVYASHTHRQVRTSFSLCARIQWFTYQSHISSYNSNSNKFGGIAIWNVWTRICGFSHFIKTIRTVSVQIQ